MNNLSSKWKPGFHCLVCPCALSNTNVASETVSVTVGQSCHRKHFLYNGYERKLLNILSIYTHTAGKERSMWPGTMAAVIHDQLINVIQMLQLYINGM